MGKPFEWPVTRDAKEKKVNIPLLDRGTMGNLDGKSEAGDVAGNGKRDFPSLLTV